jgi:hypothetical protein
MHLVTVLRYAVNVAPQSLHSNSRGPTLAEPEQLCFEQ